MTCKQSRTEYIEAVTNFVELTAHIAADQARYLELLRTNPLHAAADDVLQWGIYMDCMQRLIDEQRRCFAHYRDEAAVHSRA
jgi:hypothetical protein